MVPDVSILFRHRVRPVAPRAVLLLGNERREKGGWEKWRDDREDDGALRDCGNEVKRISSRMI